MSVCNCPHGHELHNEYFDRGQKIRALEAQVRMAAKAAVALEADAEIWRGNHRRQLLRAEKAEAERDALKARVAGAESRLRVRTIAPSSWTMGGTDEWIHDVLLFLKGGGRESGGRTVASGEVSEPIGLPRAAANPPPSQRYCPNCGDSLTTPFCPNHLYDDGKEDDAPFSFPKKIDIERLGERVRHRRRHAKPPPSQERGT